jgi:hypothetical protein
MQLSHPVLIRILEGIVETGEKPKKLLLFSQKQPEKLESLFGCIGPKNPKS